MIRIAIVAVLLTSSAAFAKDPIPTNVTVGARGIVEKVDWSFTPDKPVQFSKLKRCAAVTIKNDEINLSDSASRFGNQTTLGGRDTFKLIDDQGMFLVAQGWIEKPVFAFKWILRFDVEVALEGQSVKIIMRNIQLAMSNTGSASNNGFNSLSTSYRFKQNYETLQTAANALKSCIIE